MRIQLRTTHLLAALAALLSVFVLAACGGSSSSNDDGASGGELLTVEGRSVSATPDEIVLRTADGDRTFQVTAEDRPAVDPEHFESHAGVETLGFRIFYRTEGETDYAVSAEEIPGSTLGFE